MVSDFVTEKNGFLCLTEEEYQAAKRNNPNIKMSARKLLEYGESREGYWTSDKFMKQMEYVVETAEAKYSKSKVIVYSGFLIKAAATALSVRMH